MISWVLGRGGLLGGSVERQIVRAGRVWAPSKHFFWDDDAAFEKQINQSVEQFMEFVGADNWSILWCAGVGVVSSSSDVLNSEVQKIQRLLGRLSECPSQFLQNGNLFFASSAGGVYAGSECPPFTEQTEPIPVADYGRQKLHCEKLFADFTRSFSSSSVIGRIANLYGPGQSRTKGQGLITTICRSTLLGSPIEIYVPLETVRNYIYIDDAASLVVGLMNHIANIDEVKTLTKIIASDQNISLSFLLAECARVFKKRPHIVLTRAHNSNLQTVDLRMESSTNTTTDQYGFTSLAVGIDRIRCQLLAELQNGNLVSF
jgi:UDP-glucose 4-epimerase